MSALSFRVVGARSEVHAVSPTLLFDLEIAESEDREIHGIALRTQVRIEPQRRGYSPEAEEQLLALFGERLRWEETLRSFTWGRVSHFVPGFKGSYRLSLPFPCSYDLDVSASRYLHALGDGSIPLRFLFSGMVYAHDGRALQADPAPWTREAFFALPVRTWRELMDYYFPGGGWLRLRRETLDALLRVKSTRALASFDDVVQQLLQKEGPL